MAVAATHLTTGANATNTNSYSTASVTPSASVLVLVWVSGTGTNSATAPTVTGNGLTYVLADEAHSDGNVISEYLYRAMGTPSAGALNISWTAGNVTGCNWSVAEFSGVDTTGTNGSGAVAETAVANANATSVTVTLTGITAGNATAGGFATASALPVTPGAGYTELGEAAHNNPATVIQSEWREDGSTIVDASWLTAQNSVGIGVEIAAASAAEPSGEAHLSATATIGAGGVKGLSAVATRSVTATIGAEGTLEGTGLTGTASVDEAVEITAEGLVATDSGADRPITATVEATGTAGLTGTVPVAITASRTAAGFVASSAGSARALTASVTAAGTVAAELAGQASVASTATILATGNVATSAEAHVIGHCNITAPSLVGVQMALFTPPTRDEGSSDFFFGRYKIPVGQSVVRVGDTFSTTPYPWLGDIADLTEGVDYFLGGRTYVITEATADELVAAGYTVDEA